MTTAERTAQPATASVCSTWTPPCASVLMAAVGEGSARNVIHRRSSRQTKVLILDFGLKYTHLIARLVRELCVSAECLPGTTSVFAIRAIAPSLIILSGGPDRVQEPASGFLDYVLKNEIAVLGICSGLHLLVNLLRGFLVLPAESQQQREEKYGCMEVRVDKESELFKDCYAEEGEDTQSVWMMNYGDDIVQVLPLGFRVLSRTMQNGVAAMECSEKKLYGMQFHPEGNLISCRESLLFSSDFYLDSICSKEMIRTTSKRVYMLNYNTIIHAEVFRNMEGDMP